ncbi:MAG: copper resistance protein CopC [Anaerolineaceae bacterium]|nr:MAG: copper resistance protein CopC [Anaerolineaceae bacterium]
MYLRRSILYILALFLMLLVVFFMALPVAAHQDLERAEPEIDAVLNMSPSVVCVWFAGELDSFESTLTVHDARDRQIDLGDASISHEDRRLLQVSLPNALPVGQYTVRWTAVDDEDAHPIQGEYTFTIAGGTSAAPGSYPVAVLGVGAVIVAGGAGTWAWARRRKNSS